MHPGGGHVEEGVIVGGAPIGHRGGRIVDAGDGDRDGGAGAAAVAVRGGVGERVGGGGSNRERVERPVRIVAVGAVGVQLQQRPGGKGDGGTDVGGRAVDRGDYQSEERRGGSVVGCQGGGGHQECSVDGRATSIEPRGG